MSIVKPLYQGNGLMLSDAIRYLQEVKKEYGDLCVSSSLYDDVVHIFIHRREGELRPDNTCSRDNNKEGLYLGIW